MSHEAHGKVLEQFRYLFYEYNANLKNLCFSMDTEVGLVRLGQFFEQF